MADLLAALPGAPRCEPVVVQTTGDTLADVPVAQLGGQGVFVKEVQLGRARRPGRPGRALRQGPARRSRRRASCWRACPSGPTPATPSVGCTLEALPAGAMVATGSVRRRAQLAWLRPDLTFCDLRGNMATRLERAREVGAGVVAVAALERLGLTEHVAEVLDARTLLPQVGQGALAVECRAGRRGRARAPRRHRRRAAHGAVRAERAFLAALGGGCTLPLGALAVHARWRRASSSIDGFLASRDGRILLRRRLTGPGVGPRDARPPAQRRVLLDECGGRSLDDWAEDAWTGPDPASRP